jgi:dihydrodipicolinate synthase/N-acetylneuraminate lyase
MSELCQLASEGKSAEAAELNNSLMSLHENLFVESNPIPVKYALWKMKLMQEGIRLPLTVLDEKYQSQVDDILRLRDLL